MDSHRNTKENAKNRVFISLKWRRINSVYIAPIPAGVRFKESTTNMVEFQNRDLKKQTGYIKLFPDKVGLCSELPPHL